MPQATRYKRAQTLLIGFCLAGVATLALGTPALQLLLNPAPQPATSTADCSAIGETFKSWKSEIKTRKPKLRSGERSRSPSLLAVTSPNDTPQQGIYVAGILTKLRSSQVGFYIARLTSKEGSLDLSFKPQGNRHPGFFISWLPSSKAIPGASITDLHLSSFAVSEANAKWRTLLSGEVIYRNSATRKGTLPLRQGFAFDSRPDAFVWAPQGATIFEPYLSNTTSVLTVPFLKKNTLFLATQKRVEQLRAQSGSIVRRVLPSQFSARVEVTVRISDEQGTESTSSLLEAELVSLDGRNRSVEWRKKLPVPPGLRARSIHEVEGGYLILGSVAATGEGNGKGIVLKITRDGNLDRNFGTTSPGILPIGEGADTPLDVAKISSLRLRRDVLVAVDATSHSVLLYDLTTGASVVKTETILPTSLQADPQTALFEHSSIPRLLTLIRNRSERGLSLQHTCLGSSPQFIPVDPSQAALPAYNASNPCDVDGDAQVTAKDGAELLAWLARYGVSSVPKPPSVEGMGPFLDVDADGNVTAGDFFQVMSCLEGAPVTPPTGGTPVSNTPTATSIPLSPTDTPSIPGTSIPGTSIPGTSIPSTSSPKPTASSAPTNALTPTPTPPTTPGAPPTSITAPTDTPTQVSTPTNVPGTTPSNPTTTPTPESIEGALEGVTKTKDGLEAYGWACRPSNAAPLAVTLSISGTTVGTGVASLPRADLTKCRGRTTHGFSIALQPPSTLEIAWKELIAVAADASGSGTLLSPQPVVLTAGDIFPLLGNTYPKGIFFRTGAESLFSTNGRIATPWAPDLTSNRPLWLSDFTKLYGVFAKTLTEEYTNFAVEQSNQNLKDAAAQPGQLALLHFNGLGVQPSWPETQQFGPQDWMYLPGCDSTGPVTAAATQVTLPWSCLARFKKCLQGPKTGQPGAPACIPENLVAIQRKSDGTLDWATTEYLKVTDLPPDTTTPTTNFQITVARGQFGSTSKRYTTKVYLAPFAHNGPWPTWSDQINWNFNLTRPETQTKYTQALLTYLGANGVLSSIDGITLDISWWDAQRNEGRLIDYNVDGVADAGYSGAANLYARGMVDFHRKLKSALGPTKIVLADGWTRSARDYHVLNGSESEGFSGPEDGELTAWSTGYNFINYVPNRTSRPHLKYVVTKKLASLGALRLSMAGATALGAAVANTDYPQEFLSVCDEATELATSFNHNGMPIADELVGGVLRKRGWLGQPIDGLVRPALSAPRKHPSGVTDLRDLMAGVGNVTIQKFADRSEISPSAGTPRQFSVEIKGDTVARRLKAVSSSDYTLILDIKSEGALDGFEDDLLIPRKLMVTSNEQLAATTPPPAPRPVTLTKQNLKLESPFGQQWTRVVFFFRNSYDNNDLTFTLSFEGSRKVSVRNISLVHAPDLTVRRFENGLVFANPSLRPVQFDLQAHYPILYPGTPFRRLTASECQDAVHNNGQVVGTSIEVPAQDGVFLIRNGQ